ncbi:MAG: acetylglutamate kinase [Gemmatimonadetes bacterium]|nr:acetylglutamate kinase [Gemmatimonadota bacterium]MBI2614535.1 acetylglutamate kinase [Gemmatimonadota bacterium]
MRVIKVGGGEMEDAAWLDRFAAGVKHAWPAVIVHGGGRRISAWQERLGLPVEMRDGVRVTTAEVAELVQMVLCGPIRSAIVRALRSRGVDAVGVAGGDGCFTVELLDPERLGRVGRVTGVDCGFLLGLLERGITPVLAPVSVGPDGTAVNVNADDAAAAVANALDAVELLFVSDVPGVMRGAERIAAVTPADLDGLIAGGVVQGGMVAKLKAAVAASRAPARIGDVGMLTDPTRGTVITAAGAAGAAA